MLCCFGLWGCKIPEFVEIQNSNTLANLETQQQPRTGKGQFSFQSQRRQCQRMFKLLHNCTPLTCQQGNAQNFPSQASTICELRTYRCSSWIQKRQRNQRSNCQHPLDYRKSKRVLKKSIYLCFIDYTKGFDFVDHKNTVENSSRDGNTRPPYLLPERSICR